MSFRGLQASRPARGGALLLAISERFGAFGLVCCITAATMVCSVSIAMFAMAVLLPHDTQSVRVVFYLSLSIPVIVAPIVSMAIVRLLAHLSNANTALEQLVRTDPLTGLLNRRGFFEACENNRISAASALVGIVDIDRFKQLNDAHGHAMGDRALCALASGLRSLLGQDSIVGRLGGDEFAFVVCNPAARVVDVVHQQLAFPVEGSVVVRATIGLAELDADSQSRESIGLALSRADSDLYRKKVSRAGASSDIPEPRIRARAR
jgi:diguanylate cyclase (GGDEF)-like protein